MKYRSFINSALARKESLAEYKIYESGEYFLIEFSDTDYDKIMRNLQYKYDNENGVSLGCIGQDNKYYTLTSQGINCSGKSGIKYNRLHHAVDKAAKKSNKIVSRELMMEKRLSNYRGSEVINRRSSAAYKKCTYIDKENGIIISFRFKKAPVSGRPLIVFFHGAGSIGSDNIRPMFDYLPVRLRLSGSKCNVLIPQTPYGVNSYKGYNEAAYYKSIDCLIKQLVDSSAADSGRIYLIGTSFGACCVWHMLYLFPGQYACGIPAMGGLPDGFMNKKADINRLAHENIWIAHSANDKNVNISVDDACFKKLIDMKAGVRWEKFGHAMSYIFYLKEPWKEWMFNQRKS